MDFTATDAAELTRIALRSANTIFIKLRKKTAAQCAEISPLNRIAELDESYFSKETECCLNHRHDHLCLSLLKLLCQNPL